jgi:hypothetical protein
MQLALQELNNLMCFAMTQALWFQFHLLRQPIVNAKLKLVFNQNKLLNLVLGWNYTRALGVRYC